MSEKVEIKCGLKDSVEQSSLALDLGEKEQNSTIDIEKLQEQLKVKENLNRTQNQGNHNEKNKGEQFSQAQNKCQQKSEKKEKQKVQMEEEIPDKFYDSDLASVNQKDFLSDKEPPKDIVHERKLLQKQKKYHIYKTIIKVGEGIDKPAPFDEIQLRYRKMQMTKAEDLKLAKNIEFIQSSSFLVYNLGKKYSQLQKFVISMKKGEVSLFQLQWIEVSQKSNIKVLKQREAYVIEVKQWITVVDIDNNSEILKYLIKRGEGPNRVSKYDEVSFEGSIEWKGIKVWQKSYKLLKIEQDIIQGMQPIIWKTLSTMKRNQIAQVHLNDQNMRTVSMVVDKEMYQKQKQRSKTTSKYQQLIKAYQQKQKQGKIDEQIVEKNEQEKEKVHKNQWKVRLQIKQYINIDDVYMNGKLLKKLLVKGVSTAKPDNESLIYYALQYLDDEKNLLFKDSCFDSDWWEDYSMLDKLTCRKQYMDQYKMSKMLKNSMERMKPAQISEIQCRDLSLFQYGHDYEELKSLWPKEKQFPPKKVYIIVRVYNFTQGKNCFNMVIEQKIEESKRKKAVGVKLLNQGKYDKALKIFENIVSYYNSGDINQNGYEEKISGLMNSILCLMKLNQFNKMIPLCNTVLEKPRHGFNQDKMRINGQGVKVEGNLNNVEEQLDDRQLVNLQQNKKITDKCLYRKALALLKIGQSKQSIQCLDKIDNKSEQVIQLKLEAEKHLQNYQQKSKKIFKNMFGV